MLIIGDLATNFYYDIVNIPDIDIIHSNSNEELIKKHLEIKSEPLYSYGALNTYTENNKIFNLYNSDKLLVLKSILKDNMADNDEIKIASPKVLFSWISMKTSYIHNNLKKWENNMLIYHYLYHKYFKNFSEKELVKLKYSITHINILGAMGFEMQHKSYQYIEFHTFTKDSLYDLFTIHPKSLYKQILIKKHSIYGDLLSKRHWDKLIYSHKIDTVLERLYVDSSNEYLIPEIMYGQINSYSVLELIHKSIMNLCTGVNSVWLSKFVKENYCEILDNVDLLFADTLYSAIKDNELTDV